MVDDGRKRMQRSPAIRKRAVEYPDDGDSSVEKQILAECGENGEAELQTLDEDMKQKHRTIDEITRTLPYCFLT